jgi:hypothetical protein
MNKFLSTIAWALLASPAWAQTTADTPPIGQAVSGNNSTAAGVSGTGLLKNGTAVTRSSHGDVGREAAGIDKQGHIVDKSTAVIGAAPGKEVGVNAQATNTTAPHNGKEDAEATGGRGQSGTLAERKILKADARAVKTPPGSRLKTEAAARATREKRAERKQERARKLGEHGADRTAESR